MIGIAAALSGAVLIASMHYTPLSKELACEEILLFIQEEFAADFGFSDDFRAIYVAIADQGMDIDSSGFSAKCVPDNASKGIGSAGGKLLGADCDVAAGCCSVLNLKGRWSVNCGWRVGGGQCRLYQDRRAASYVLPVDGHIRNRSFDNLYVVECNPSAISHGHIPRGLGGDHGRLVGDTGLADGVSGGAKCPCSEDYANSSDSQHEGVQQRGDRRGRIIPAVLFVLATNCIVVGCIIASFTARNLFMAGFWTVMGLTIPIAMYLSVYIQ